MKRSALGIGVSLGTTAGTSGHRDLPRPPLAAVLLLTATIPIAMAGAGGRPARRVSPHWQLEQLEGPSHSQCLSSPGSGPAHSTVPRAGVDGDRPAAPPCARAASESAGPLLPRSRAPTRPRTVCRAVGEPVPGPAVLWRARGGPLARSRGPVRPAPGVPAQSGPAMRRSAQLPGPAAARYPGPA